MTKHITLTITQEIRNHTHVLGTLTLFNKLDNATLRTMYLQFTQAALHGMEEEAVLPVLRQLQLIDGNFFNENVEPCTITNVNVCDTYYFLENVTFSVQSRTR